MGGIIIHSLLLLTLITACQSAQHSPAAPSETKQALLSLMDRQQKAWNQGNIDQFMDGYLRSDSLRFASGSQVRYGWQTVKERYKSTYPDREAMGTLSFFDRDIKLLGNRHAMLFGRWQLTRKQDTLGGLYTLVFQKTDDQRQIIHDHTSN